MVAQVDKIYWKLNKRATLKRFISYLFVEGRPVTTKGSFINFFVFPFLRFLSKIPVVKYDQPIFILGMGRSGTTILGVLLSMHRDVCFLNEPKAGWNIIDPIEDVSGNYNKGLSKYRLDENDADTVKIRTARRLYRMYSRLMFSKQIIDKYPELSFRTKYVKKIFPKAKFIILIRDGRATAQSVSNWNKRHCKTTRHGEVHDWWGVNDRKWLNMVNELAKSDEDFLPMVDQLFQLDCDTDRAIVEWILTMRESERIKQDFPNDTLEVRYEALHQDSTIEKILRFCDLNSDRLMLEYWKSKLSTPPTYPDPVLSPDLQNLLNQTLTMKGY